MIPEKCHKYPPKGLVELKLDCPKIILVSPVNGESLDCFTLHINQPDKTNVTYYTKDLDEEHTFSLDFIPDGSIKVPFRLNPNGIGHGYRNSFTSVWHRLPHGAGDGFGQVLDLTANKGRFSPPKIRYFVDFPDCDGVTARTVEDPDTYIEC